MTNISFEFFPPKTKEGLDKLLITAKELSKYKPEYFSVTYGAGGSTRKPTLQAVKQLQQHTKIPVAPHITCVDSTAKIFKEICDEYKQMGIRQIVALRGDRPSGCGITNQEFKHANQLVEWIKNNYTDSFDLTVAAYPECHPETKTLCDEIKYFQQKVNAGATQAVTQYFFNVDGYRNFCNKCREQKIKIDITPGIMPINNLDGLERFSKLCGAEIPRWLHQQLISFGDDKIAFKQFTTEFLTQHCQALLDAGAPGLHFYTLNRLQPTKDIVDGLLKQNSKLDEKAYCS